MARFFPPTAPEGSPSSERRVRRSLEALDDDWTVFHSVAWQSKRGRNEGDGEADFILVHPRRGVIVLEVKGGQITVDKGRWYSLSASGETFSIKNPIEQAVASKHALLRYLDALFPSSRVPPVVHGVVFPTGTVAQGIGMQAPREIVIDGADLARIEAALDRLCRHWGVSASLKAEDVSSLRKLLAPTIQIRTTLRNAIADSMAELISLTDQQIRALQGLRRSRRAVIYGGAGTGKTVLAAERVRRLCGEGFTVLLTCFNRPLADHVANELKDVPGATVATFHQLCMLQARRARLPFPTEPDSEWWDTKAPDLLVDTATANKLAFDAIVVDEGQDFASSWIQALLLLLASPDDGPFYVFADTQQSIYHREWAVPPEWTPYDLDINCRNTLPIAERVAGVFGEKPHSLGAPGPKPQFMRVRSADDLIDLVPRVVQDLLDAEHLSPEQCVVLAPSRKILDRLLEVALGDYTFVQPGKYGIVVETIQRFKGLEADVVVVCLGDLDMSDPHARALAYISMSRARGLLIVVGSKATQEGLNWGRT